MPLIKTSGIILNSRPMGEYDRLVEIFSDDLGKIDGIAKGARSFKNRFGGSLEPFTHCRLGLFRKSNNSLYRIESADIIESFSRIREDLTLLLYASRMVDALRKLTPLEDPSKTLFSLLHNSLGAIVSGTPVETILFYYQIQILHIAGLGLRLDGCVRCNREMKDTKIAISMAEGGLLCTLCHDRVSGGCVVASGGTIAVIRKWQSISPHYLNRFTLSNSIRGEIKGILDMYITHITGKRLVDVQRYVNSK
ncbi:MAG: DNA repair protein RecO [Nitrospirae bacterium]|nr:DNA repair protein RecO [Nitrospirota bacterium]